MLETDELGDFLASLRKVRDYDVNWRSPADGEPFSGLARRVDELIATTRRALPKWKTLCAPAITTSSTSQAARAGNTPIGKAGQWSRSSSHSAKRSAHLVHAVHCGTIRMIIEGEVVEFYLAE